jgi:hypothetical protein
MPSTYTIHAPDVAASFGHGNDQRQNAAKADNTTHKPFDMPSPGNRAHVDSAPENEKAVSDFSLTAFGTTGRDGGIRTRDPLHPMQVRYQAALRPERKRV